jgi:hypothetical protein
MSSSAMTVLYQTARRMYSGKRAERSRPAPVNPGASRSARVAGVSRRFATAFDRTEFQALTLLPAHGMAVSCL